MLDFIEYILPWWATGIVMGTIIGLFCAILDGVKAPTPPPIERKEVPPPPAPPPPK